MGTKHIHAEVIKAWADGEEIEMFIASIQQWHHAQTPMWDTTTRYRVKPKNIVVLRHVQYLVDLRDTSTQISMYPNVQYTFTPEGKLVSVEMIK